MKRITLILSIALLAAMSISLVSCGKEGPVYEKYLSMKNQIWDRFDQKLYDIPITDISKTYDITLSVRITDKFEYDSFPVYVILTTPSGEERMREVSVPVRENGKLLGVANGTVYQSSVILWKNINVAEKGNCKISIENMIPKIQTEGIDAIGIIVTKSE